MGQSKNSVCYIYLLGLLKDTNVRSFKTTLMFFIVMISKEHN